MDISGMKRIFSSGIADKAPDLIKDHETFAISDALDTTRIAAQIEKIIEYHGMTCRVYNANRSLSIASALIPTPQTILFGVISALSIGIHNLATRNPDYEVIKCLVDNQVIVVYKKNC